MTKRPLAAVILAAGQGKRLKADVPKVLVPACGRTLVEHVLEALAPLGAGPTVVVYGHGGNAVRDALADRGVSFAHQAEQRGTGHAVQCGLAGLGAFDGDVLVLCGDTPLLTTAALEALLADHRASQRALTVLSAELADPGSLGRILRDDAGALRAIREAADASDAERAVREINTGVIVVRSEHLGSALDRLQPDNAQGELYLTDVPGLLLADGLAVGAYRTADAGAAFGVNRPAELAEAVRQLRRRILDALMTDGVRVEDPDTTVVDAGARVARGAVLRPFTLVEGEVTVAPGCVVGPHASLFGSTSLAEGAEASGHVVLEDCELGRGAAVRGPARLRGARLAAGAVIEPDRVS